MSAIASVKLVGSFGIAIIVRECVLKDHTTDALNTRAANGIATMLVQYSRTWAGNSQIAQPMYY